MRATPVALLGLLLTTGALVAQQPAPVTLTLAQIQKPTSDSWPTYNGDYSGRRFSSLTKINANNVKNLSLRLAVHVSALPNSWTDSEAAKSMLATTTSAPFSSVTITTYVRSCVLQLLERSIRESADVEEQRAS